ncbi:alpha/beta fold hydrolase [Mycolicibacterium sp. A43C]
MGEVGSVAERVRRQMVSVSDGCQLAVQIRGNVQDKTVLLVHGFPDDHRVWDCVAERLEDRFNVITVDTRGSGDSSRPPAIHGYRVSRLAKDLAEVIDAVSDRPVHVVGHDWGSVQGWDLITSAQGAGRVASFTSISGGYLDHLPTWVRDQKRRGWAGVLALAALWKTPVYMGVFQIPILAPALCRLGIVDSTIVAARWLEERRRPTTNEGGGARRNWAALKLYSANVFPGLRNASPRGTTVPVQILLATKDVFIPAAVQRDLPANVPTSRVVPLPAGHWAPLSAPDRVAQHITDWVNRNERNTDHGSTEAL